MRLQIDTKERTIKVDENVKFNELIKVLNKLLPKEWKEYTLETSGIWHWVNPIVWPVTQPWKIGDVIYQPYTTCGTEHSPDKNPYQVINSVYNIEVLN
jgi:hypothetical protein